MRNKISILLFLSVFLFPLSNYAQKYTISGYITDGTSTEKLINATVYDQISKKGVVSNFYGFYSLTLNSADVKMLYSFVGFNPQQIEFKLTKDTVINIVLGSTIELEGVVVYGSKAEMAVKNTQMSTIDIPMKQIELLPSFLGEPDVIKAIQLMPGVQSGSEASSGLYVRGGGPDQNLILLDGVPVYNVNHLFGFFSVFNPSAISSVTLYKGSFPARYGGRLSSVIDIRMKEGNLQEYHGELSVGIIASKFSVEGPIIKDKTSFMISGRRTYIDLLARPLIRSATEGGIVGYYFYDLNVKLNHKFSDKSRLFLSAYTGRDEFYATIEDNYRSDGEMYTDELKASLWWGNLTTALRWNYMLSNKLFSNSTITYSQYSYDTGITNKYSSPDGESEIGVKYISGIEDLSAKVDFDWSPSPEHSIKFGTNYTYHSFNPGVTSLKIDIDGSNIDFNAGNDTVKAHEAYVYFEDNYEITKKLKANIGVHASTFNVQEKFYYSVEPRISARYLFSDVLSAKAAYSLMTQYIHLLSNTTIGLPTDLWVPVTKNILPQTAHQFNAGLFYKINDQIDISIEGFYKYMNNIIDYLDGASFVGSTSSWEDKVAMGEGWSYGGELLLKKNVGKTTGWIGYTLSWTDRKFDEINFGNIYPAKYDRRHDISIVLMHKFNDEVDMGATWVYGTGYALSLATQTFAGLPDWYGGYFNNHSYYPGRNNYRMPSYHRFDIGFNFHKEKRFGTRTWSIGIYNAYNRSNPFFLMFGYEYTNNYEDSERVLQQLSIFPIIPSISYKFKF